MTTKPTPQELDVFLKGLSDSELLELVTSRAHSDNRTPIIFISKSTGDSCGIDNDAWQLAFNESRRRTAFIRKEGQGTDQNKDVPSQMRLRVAKERPFFSGPQFSFSNPSLEALLEPNPILGLEEIPINNGGRSDFDGLFEKLLEGHRRLPADDTIHQLRHNALVCGLDHLGPLDGTQYIASDYHKRMHGRREMTATERFEKFVERLPIEELFELGDLLFLQKNLFGPGVYHSVTLGEEERIYQTDAAFVYEQIKSRFNTDPQG